MPLNCLSNIKFSKTLLILSLIILTSIMLELKNLLFGIMDINKAYTKEKEKQFIL